MYLADVVSGKGGIVFDTAGTLFDLESLDPAIRANLSQEEADQFKQKMAAHAESTTPGIRNAFNLEAQALQDAQATLDEAKERATTNQQKRKLDDDAKVADQFSEEAARANDGKQG